MNSRNHQQQQQQQPQQPFVINHSFAIRQEIQRFESVHPSIYAIYDLIDLIPDTSVAQQIRDHVVCIEDSFVNSQEWTLSRSVPDLRLGIVGSLSSGKSALVHRYLTGSYMQEESPEGGRFKKEIVIDGQSYLLLIRDEGGPPEIQFTAWVDAVIFVFSLENESSFNAIYNYYTKMSHFRSASEIPLILVGTQDAISENNPRVIDDSRARKLATDLKRCSYYETCATYGLNVDKVFQDACQRTVQQRLSNSTSCLTPTNSRPTTPSTNHFIHQQQQQPPATSNLRNFSNSSTNNTAVVNRHSPTNQKLSSPSHNYGFIHKDANGQFSISRQNHILSPSAAGAAAAIQQHYTCGKKLDKVEQQTLGGMSSSSSSLLLLDDKKCLINTENNNLNNKMASFVGQPQFSSSTCLSSSPSLQQTLLDNNVSSNNQGQNHHYYHHHHHRHNSKENNKELVTPTSTPTATRKNRRRSNLFNPSSSKKDEKHKNNGDFGSGRAIPLKQGYLYKRSSKALNKDWKKKYVSLCNNGRLTYHPSLHDYMDDVHSKEISLQYVTVKVPGQKPRGSKSIVTNVPITATTTTTSNGSTGSSSAVGGISLSINDRLGGIHLNASKDDDNKVAGNRMEKNGVFEAVLKDSNFKYSQALRTNFDEGGGGGGGGGMALLSNSTTCLNSGDFLKIDTPNVKKRHRRMKSNSVKNSEYDDPDGYEFYIVSLDNKQWHFEASSNEERDEWVAAIEQQILNSLQLINDETSSSSSQFQKQANSLEAAAIQSVRKFVAGNGFCVDCQAPNPDWASLNLGILMCIECSGIHRNLGSHLSRVRSLDLDKWPPSHLSVMLAIGNALANSVWEYETKGKAKPNLHSNREEKEQWIRSKYERKEFLPPLAFNRNEVPLGQQLVQVVCGGSSNMKSIVHILALATVEDVNWPVAATQRDLRTPLHLACAMGNLALAQLLLWNNANVKSLDQDGRSSLAYARAAASIAMAKQQQSGANSLEAAMTTTCRSLIELLISYGCPDLPSSLSENVDGSGGDGGTLPRRQQQQRRGSSSSQTLASNLEKLPSSAI